VTSQTDCILPMSDGAFLVLNLNRDDIIQIVRQRSQKSVKIIKIITILNLKIQKGLFA